jgi:hypothetical protein
MRPSLTPCGQGYRDTPIHPKGIGGNSPWRDAKRWGWKSQGYAAQTPQGKPPENDTASSLATSMALARSASPVDTTARGDIEWRTVNEMA